MTLKEKLLKIIMHDHPLDDVELGELFGVSAFKVSQALRELEKEKLVYAMKFEDENPRSVQGDLKKRGGTF